MSEQIETSERLGSWAETVHGWVERLLPSGRPRDLLSGTWLGHPTHPFLVATPIGCWTSASLLDVLGQRQAAQALTGAGVISVIPTAVTGLSDWADTAGAEQRIGLVHLGLNTGASVIYATSWWARRRGHHGAGVALGIVGAVAASGAGWLGGHLAYAMGVGVDTNAFDGGPTDWTAIEWQGSRPVGESSGSGRSAIDRESPAPGDVASASSSGVALVVVSDEDGNVRVLADRCSHRGGPLSEGTFADGCVSCPWHGSRFEVRRGEVRQGPAVVPQPAYEVRRAASVLQVRRDEPRALRANSVRPDTPGQ